MIEIPRFKSEDEERDFWATHDSVAFMEGAEQVNLEYVGRECEFTLASSAESEWVVPPDERVPAISTGCVASSAW